MSASFTLPLMTWQTMSQTIPPALAAALYLERLDTSARTCLTYLAKTSGSYFDFRGRRSAHCSGSAIPLGSTLGLPFDLRGRGLAHCSGPGFLGKIVLF